MAETNKSEEIALYGLRGHLVRQAERLGVSGLSRLPLDRLEQIVKILEEE